MIDAMSHLRGVSWPLSRREAHAQMKAVERPPPGRKRPQRARSRNRTREMVASII